MRTLLLTGALLAVTACGGGTGTGTADRGASAAPSPAVSTGVSPGAVSRTGALPDSGRASCVEAYSPQTLPGRDFAFDGTVTAIAAGTSNKPDKGRLDTVAVTFAVNEWFKGGSAPTVTVDLMEPGGSDADPPAYEEGTRLLVSGEPRWGGQPLDDAIAWTCGGFTRYYEPAVADDWRRVTS